MSIAAQIEEAFKTALRAQDKATVSVLRQIKARIQEAENAPGFGGEKNDAFYTDVIGRYAKMLTKSIAELKAGGERGAALVASYTSELSYLERFLPRALSDEALTAAVEALLAGGNHVSKDLGRLTGQLMRSFKGQLDAGRARAALAARLPASDEKPAP